MKLATKGLRKLSRVKQMMQNENFYTVRLDIHDTMEESVEGEESLEAVRKRLDLHLYESENFIKFESYNGKKAVAIPKNYIVGTTVYAQGLSKRLGYHGLYIVLITGESYLYKIPYPNDAKLFYTLQALELMIPDAIITKNYSMLLWHDLYKELQKEDFEKKKKDAAEMVVKRYDQYDKLTRNGIFREGLREGDPIILRSETGEDVETTIESFQGFSDKEGVEVSTPRGIGRVKELLTNPHQPTNYSEEENFEDDKWVYEELERIHKENDFKQPGENPLTGKVSDALVWIFIIGTLAYAAYYYIIRPILAR